MKILPGKVTYKKLSANKKITVNKKTGNSKLSRKLRKGTYKIKVNVKAAGTNEYKSAVRTATVRIRVR